MEIAKLIILCILGIGLFNAALDMTEYFKWKDILKFLFVGAVFVLIYKFL